MFPAGLGFAGLVWLACVSLAHAEPASPDYCYPQRLLAIHGIQYRQDAAAARRALGKPDNIQRLTVPGTAGAFQVDRWRYPGLQLDVKASTREVETLVATGPASAMPNGVRVGMPLAEVSRCLGVDVGGMLSPELRWTPALCERGPHDWIFVGPIFTFARDAKQVRLRSIRIQRI